MKEKYIIKNKILFINDAETVDFHVQKNDYFATLSTIIELMSQDYILENKNELKKILKNLKTDLMYLQKNFLIVPNDKQELK